MTRFPIGYGSMHFVNAGRIIMLMLCLFSCAVAQRPGGGPPSGGGGPPTTTAPTPPPGPTTTDPLGRISGS